MASLFRLSIRNQRMTCLSEAMPGTKFIHLCRCNDYDKALDSISIIIAGTKIKLGNYMYCWKPLIALKSIVKKIVWSVATDWLLQQFSWNSIHGYQFHIHITTVNDNDFDIVREICPCSRELCAAMTQHA